MGWIDGFFENRSALKIPQVTLSGGTPTGIEYLGTQILGTAGDKAGLIYQWSTDVTNTTPGVGGIKANNAAVGSITTLRISDAELNASVDVQAIYGQWLSNDTITILSNSSTGNKISRFTINGVPSSTPTGWWDIPVTSGVGTLPSNLEEVAVQHSKAGIGSGSDGDKGGFKYTFSSTVEANQTTSPGNGFCRMNNATPGSVTQISFSTTDADSLALAAFLATWQVGGRIRIKSNTMADGSFHIFDITAIQDNSTWLRFTGTTVAGAAFTNNEAMAVDYFDSSEAPSYSSLESATLPAANGNNNLIVQLQTPLAANTYGRKSIYISNNTDWMGISRVIVDSYNAAVAVTPATGTWTASNSGGFVLLTQTAHGISVATGTCLYVSATANGWTIGQLVGITAIAANTITTDVVWASQGAPTLAGINTEMIPVSVAIPPLQTNSRINTDIVWTLSSHATNTKTIGIELATSATASGTSFWSPAAQTTNTLIYTPVVIINKNSKSIQNGRFGASNLAGVNAAVATVPTGAVDTSVTTYLNLTCQASAINEIITVLNRHIEVIY